MDLIPPLDPRLLTNNLSTTKYFAYITFVNPLGACEALQSEVHVIRDEEVTVEPAYSWHQPLSDIMAARAAPSCSSNENEETAKLKAKIFEGMDRTLNDDCISKIMTFVNIFELMKMASYNQRFSCIARQQRSIRILPNMASYQLTMMHLRQILRLHGFGHSALNLTISLKAFKYTHANHHLINKLVQYIGPQLRSFSLQSFNISTSQFIKLKPIMIDLTFLQIDVNYEFDYEQFNDVWPNLQTLRIRSSGVIEVLKRTSTKTTSFPKLTKLIIISNYKLYANLFETIAINFKGLKELVVINDDYYTEMNSTPIQIDFSFIPRMENLTKLHLSFGQNHHNDQIWEILSTVKSLEHLTLNVTSHRGNDNRVTISDRSLCILGMGLESLKELRICGFALTDEKVIQIIRYAKKLDSLTIYNCGVVISPALISNIVRVREAQLSKRQWPGTRSGGGLAAPDKVLNLIVELFADSGEEVVSQHLSLDFFKCLFDNL